MSAVDPDVTVRLGLIAASRIAGGAVIAPAPDVDGMEVVAVAARDADRAAKAAAEWNLAHSFGSYQDLLESDEVDAVYIGTPASLHRRWAVAALDAGRHVLCEKPLAANADDGRLIAEASARSDRVAMEGYHWRYHPLAARVRSVIDSGELGELRHIEARFDIADGRIGRDDIRWNLALGGGALMDLGCYPVQWVRFAAGGDPDVVSARAECPVDGVDGRLEAELSWPGITGLIHSSMIAEHTVNNLIVTGTDGTLTVDNPLAPQNGAGLAVETSTGRREEPVPTSATYYHQLVAFRDAIRHGTPFPTTIGDGVRTMAIIDACYRAAGMEPRPTAD